MEKSERRKLIDQHFKDKEEWRNNPNRHHVATPDESNVLDLQPIFDIVNLAMQETADKLKKEITEHTDREIARFKEQEDEPVLTQKALDEFAEIIKQNFPESEAQPEGNQDHIADARKMVHDAE